MIKNDMIQTNDVRAQAAAFFSAVIEVCEAGNHKFQRFFTQPKENHPVWKHGGAGDGGGFP